jgi:RNA polymerase sigma factor (sigma-70 family)
VQPVAASQHASMEGESDADLLVYLCFIESDPVDGEAALRELMRRYEAVLRRRCQRICSGYPLLGMEADDLVNATFYRAFERASTYKPLEKPDAHPDEHKRYTAAWLFQIATNLLIDAGRKAGRELPYEDEPSDPDAMSAADVAHLLVGSNPGRFDPQDKPLVAKAFATLPERTRLVVVWTLDKRQRSPGGRYMNRGAQSELARRLDTTPANIRQIFTRALSQIHQVVKDARRGTQSRR